MKRIVLVIFVACMAVMIGCAQIQAKIDSAAQTIVVPDLQQALADANAAVPPDTDGAACWQDSINYLNSLPTTANAGNTPHIVGLVSAIEATRIVKVGAPLQVPPIPRQLKMDCSLVVDDLAVWIVQLQATALSAIKGVGIVKQGAALKAEAAALGKP